MCVVVYVYKCIIYRPFSRHAEESHPISTPVRRCDAAPRGPPIQIPFPMHKPKPRPQYLTAWHRGAPRRDPPAPDCGDSGGPSRRGSGRRHPTRYLSVLGSVRSLPAEHWPPSEPAAPTTSLSWAMSSLRTRTAWTTRGDRRRRQVRVRQQGAVRRRLSRRAARTRAPSRMSAWARRAATSTSTPRGASSRTPFATIRTARSTTRPRPSMSFCCRLRAMRSRTRA